MSEQSLISRELEDGEENKNIAKHQALHLTHTRVERQKENENET